ncbi:restriction endonuclease [Aeromonas sp. 31P]
MAAASRGLPVQPVTAATAESMASKEDRLGLDSIYLQAKRYTDKTVGCPEIQYFAGALDLHKARKGVFIPNASFSSES